MPYSKSFQNSESGVRLSESEKGTLTETMGKKTPEERDFMFMVALRQDHPDIAVMLKPYFSGTTEYFDSASFPGFFQKALFAYKDQPEYAKTIIQATHHFDWSLVAQKEYSSVKAANERMSQDRKAFPDSRSRVGPNYAKEEDLKNFVTFVDTHLTKAVLGAGVKNKGVSLAPRAF